jgi:AraC-like DNA-binding protein
LSKINSKQDVSNLCINKVWSVELNRKITYDKDRLLLTKIKDKVAIYIQHIEKVALINKSFRESDYTIYDLSIEVGLPKYYLDFIFKYYCAVTFNEYKKIVRIHHAVELINDGYLNSNKLDSLAKHVGFASYNPFLINFKELTGVSPFEYNKNRRIFKSDYLKN